MTRKPKKRVEMLTARISRLKNGKMGCYCFCAIKGTDTVYVTYEKLTDLKEGFNEAKN